MEVNILLKFEVDSDQFVQSDKDLKTILRHLVAGDLGKILSPGKNIQLISSAVVNVDKEFGTIFIENSQAVRDIND